MAFKYRIDKQKNIVFMHFSATLDDNSLLGAFNQVYAAPEYIPVMDQCINYSDVSDLSISRLGIERLAALHENFNCLNIKWKSYIIAPNDLVFGYGRMYQILSDGSNEQIEIVRTLDAALQLIGIGPDSYPFPKQTSTETH